MTEGGWFHLVAEPVEWLGVLCLIAAAVGYEVQSGKLRSFNMVNTGSLPTLWRSRGLRNRS